jgi:hypothetical protein
MKQKPGRLEHRQSGYRAKSAEGEVRHPFFKGLREDISADGMRAH